MKLKVNNKTMEIEPDLISVAALLEYLGYKTESLAVAVGTEFVNRADYQNRELHDGDEVLIIGAAYGG